MLPFLLSGISLGTAAGLSPGPLLAFAIFQTLRHGLREGLRVAFAPLIADVPIVLLSLFVLSKVSGLGSALAWLSLVGAIFVGYLGYESLRAPGLDLEQKGPRPRSLSKGILVNLLNPNVYVFWATVGGPTMLKGLDRNDGSALSFAAGFYACIVGSKVLMVLLVSRSREILTGRGYKLTMRMLGILLLAVAAWMFATGIAGVRCPSDLQSQQ